MGELVTFATQAGIFFLFTPFCLLARYGGRAIDLRKASAERRATMRTYGIDDLAWEHGRRGDSRRFRQPAHAAPAVYARTADGSSSSVRTPACAR